MMTMLEDNGWQGIKEEPGERGEIIHDFTADFCKLVANYGS